MDHHRESRKRLRPWLERMIVRGDCPGLVWDNKEERTFRIPWRHFNNKDWDAKDSQVFMEWAKYTGKYHDGDKLDYPVWKTRLRCALKKIPEIKELRERHHLEDPDPYRVYQFIDVPVMKKVSDGDSDSLSPGSSASFYANSPSVRDFFEESVMQHKYSDVPFLAPKHQSNVPTVVYDDIPFNYNNLAIKSESVAYQHFNHNATDVSNCHIDGQYRGNEITYFGNFNIAPQPNFLYEMPSSSQNFSDLNAIIPSELSLLRNEAARMHVGNESMKASLPSDLMSVESADLCSMNLSANPSIGLLESQSGSADVNVMHITVNYGFPHFVALQKKVAANGCRLYYGDSQLQHTIMEEELFGPRTVSQIEMPDVKNIMEVCDEQKNFISELLDSMERGLILTYKNGDIYAQRLCRTRVFVTDGVSESKLLYRKNQAPTMVFDFGAFRTNFDNHHATKDCPMPKHFFYLTFGQEIKGNRSDPLGRVIIHVEVVHSGAVEYARKFSLPDASQSLSLQESSFDTNDRLLLKFKNMGINK